MFRLPSRQFYLPAPVVTGRRREAPHLAVGVGLLVLLTIVVDWGPPVGLLNLPPLDWALIVVACAALAFC